MRQMPFGGAEDDSASSQKREEGCLRAEVKGTVQNVVCHVLGARRDQGKQTCKPLTRARGPRARKEQSKSCLSHALNVNEAGRAHKNAAARLLPPSFATRAAAPLKRAKGLVLAERA